MQQIRSYIAWFFFFLTLSFFIYIAIRSSLPTPQGHIVSPETETPTSTNTPKVINTSKKSTTPEEIIKETLSGSDGLYGVVLVDLSTNKRTALNEHHEFASASLYKLWIMATVYDEIKKGALKETDMLKRDVSSLNEAFNISSESAEKTEGVIELSIADALSSMITISDNYAALLLSEKIGLSKVNTFLVSHQLFETKVGSNDALPTTTPHDVALFFEKIYTHSLIDETYDEKMLTLLKSQKLNQKIPKMFPPTTIVAHKTGELGTFNHDAGIIYSPSGNYILAVLSETAIPQNAQSTIADLSYNIFSYYTKD